MPSDRFNKETWQRFCKIAKPFFVSEQRWSATGMLALLVSFSLAITGINYLLSYVGRDFMNALTLKEKSEFIHQIYRYLGTFAVATPIVVFYRYCEERMGLVWRRWLTHHLMRRYLSKRAYYRMNWFGGIDNPDQRLAEDCRSFCGQTLSFTLILLNSAIQLLSFIHILWSISGYLVLAVVLYAGIGSLMTYLLGHPLIGLDFMQLKKEADFRYKMINIRDNAESVAFYRGEEKEFTRARQCLKVALRNFLEIINWNRNLGFFTTGYNYLITILPTVIVAPLYLSGKIELGVVMQANFAFGISLGALSIIVQHFQGISSFVAVINRLGTFADFLEELQAPQCDPHNGGCLEVENGDRVRFENVTILTPRRDQILTVGLTFDLREQGMMILGPSGSGKSSIFRVIGGLWSAGTGKVIAPPPEHTFFFPQRPYMVLGTLRSLLVYSMTRRGISDRELLEALERVGLSQMLKRVGGLGATMDWPNVLATGEQQRLAFARMLLVKPRFAFLDEATTAVDPEVENQLYQILKQTVGNYISIGHQATLAKHHSVALELAGDGNWKLEALRP